MRAKPFQNFPDLDVGIETAVFALASTRMTRRVVESIFVVFKFGLSGRNVSKLYYCSFCLSIHIAYLCI